MNLLIQPPPETSGVGSMGVSKHIDHHGGLPCLKILSGFFHMVMVVTLKLRATSYLIGGIATLHECSLQAALVRARYSGAAPGCDDKRRRFFSMWVTSVIQRFFVPPASLSRCPFSLVTDSPLSGLQSLHQGLSVKRAFSSQRILSIRNLSRFPLFIFHHRSHPPLCR